MTASKKAQKTKLRIALDSGDNLAILYAHRELIVDNMETVNIEIKEITQLSAQLTQVNREILKLEGSKEKLPQEEQDNLDEDEAIRKRLGGR